MDVDHGISDGFDEAAIARRRAVANALGHAPALIRYAVRFTGSIEDAEDAYQRGMEVALREGPDTDPQSFVAWLHAIIRHEALRLARLRRRETPHEDAELTELAGATGGGYNDAVHVVAWRERYRTIQDALVGLTEAERVCLMLRTAGASRSEIVEITGFSLRKVERAIVEGRGRLRRGELQLAAGRRCDEIQLLIDPVLDGEASGHQHRRLSRHVRHCAACRSAYRTRRAQSQVLASFVPGLLVAPALTPAMGSDPSLAISWWERTTSGAAARMGQATQLWLDLPALASTRAGASAVVAAAAAALGTPMVVQAMREDRPPPRPPAVAAAAPARPAPVRVVTPAPAPVTPAVKPKPKPAAKVKPAAAPRPARKRTTATAPRRTVTTTTRTWSPPPRPTYTPPPAPTRSSGGSTSASSSSSSSAAQEFGP